jgi:hypothetical protein
MGFFEDRFGMSPPLPFSLFLALFLGILPVTRLSDERRTLGEYRLLLTDFPILLRFRLEEVVFLFLAFLSEVLAERGRHDDWRGLVSVLFFLGVLLNHKQPSDCHVVFQPGRTPPEMDLHGSSGSVSTSHCCQFTTQRLLPS